MEVSNFELILKPQSPAAPSGTAAVDRVLQGYFLEITNLEEVELQYLLEFIAFPPPPGTPNREFRSLSGNALCIVDTGGTDNLFGTIDGALTSSVFVPRFPLPGPLPGSSTRLIKIPPGATALVAVLPSAFGVINPIEPTPLLLPNFEVRGYVRIRLPPLFRFPIFGRQIDRPARVLLTPQNRATFLTAADTISGQTQTGLRLASGKALNEVTPEFGFIFPIKPALQDAELAPYIGALVESVPVEARAELLAVLLAQVDQDNADVQGFNRSLAAADIPFAIERRTLRNDDRKAHGSQPNPASGASSDELREASSTALQSGRQLRPK